MSKKKKLIRKNFRDSVFSRDNNRCVICGETKSLDAHHIIDRNNMPNGGYVKENGISVCEACHLKCEIFHISKGKNYVKGYHPDDLFNLIDSSTKLAIYKSKKLGV